MFWIGCANDECVHVSAAVHLCLLTTSGKAEKKNKNQADSVPDFPVVLQHH